MNEKVSVIIPNYNRKHLLSRTIDSVLNQSYTNIEIIIIDDNSSDGSKKMIEDYSQKHENIVCRFLSQNKGANFCRNLGVELSDGKYIAFLDSDDIFLPSKLEEQMKVFRKNENVGIVFTDYSINGKVVSNHEEGYIQLEDIIFRNTMGGFSTCVVSKSIFRNVGGLDERLPSCQDWDFYLKVLNEKVGYYLGSCLVEYYLQEDSISRNKTKVIEGHQLLFLKIKDINDIHQITSPANLDIEQKILLGDIYRRFSEFSKSKKLYSECMNKRITTKLILKLLSVSFGVSFYSNFNRIRKKFFV